MIKELIRSAKSGGSLWLPDLREHFRKCPEASRVVLRLIGNNGFARDYTLFVPAAEEEAETKFVLRYVASNIFNIFSVFSGRMVQIYCDDQLKSLLETLPGLFDASGGLGKVRNIARRIYGVFEICFIPLKEYRPLPDSEKPDSEDLASKLLNLCSAAEKTSCLGVDIGGSDIKLAASVNGKLIYTKEYDWNPAASLTAEGIIDPILFLITEAREKIEENGGKLEAVGICFPDIVINDKIVGGETPKTKAMRENPAIDYEKEFAKFGELKNHVLSLCAPGAVVHLINDGSMTAFTAAIELAAVGENDLIKEGVMAHSLGTELGTGWLFEDGTVPTWPLELYDLLLDMGDYPAAAFQPEDLRSTRNENSGMNGLRRYLGQAAVYRLAWKYNPELLNGFVERSGDLMYVPTAPTDLRKPCLEHLMRMASQGVPEAEEIFREIGSNLSVVNREMNWLFGSTPKTRILFGRFVKSRRCFELLCEGFEKGGTGIALIAADEDLANTNLMKQLSLMPEITVAQFAQAVGSIYYSMI